MKGFRARLRRIADKLTGRVADLAKSRRRHKVWREHAEKLDAKAVKARNSGHLVRAITLEHRAARAHLKALYWKTRVRRDKDAIKALKQHEAGLAAEEAKWIKEHGVVFEGHNKVRGGTDRQRIKAALGRAMLNYRNHDQPGYYSMTGGVRDYLHALYHYAMGRIWDCSTFGDGIYIVCGLTPPSGPDTLRVGGFTETQLEHGHKVTEAEARNGDAVIYLRYPGDVVGHHMELIWDHEEKVTCGHGDEAIDLAGDGSYDHFGDGLFEIRSYLAAA